MFIVYLNKNKKLITHELIQLGTQIYCPTIEEDHLIISCYINARKYLIKDVLSDVEIYYNMEILTSIEFIQNEQFMKKGRSFLIGLIALAQISCTDVPLADVNISCNDYITGNRKDIEIELANVYSLADIEQRFADVTEFSYVNNFMTFNTSTISLAYAGFKSEFEELNLIKSFTDVNGKITNVPNDTFFNQSNMTNVHLPNVTTIGERAFYGCGLIGKVDFPNLTSITAGSYTFNQCAELTELYMPKLSLLINTNTFTSTPKLLKITVDRALETSNAGGMDAQLLAKQNAGCEIVFIDNP